MSESPTFDWGDVRNDAVEWFGDTPGAQIEERIVRVFVKEPRLVIRTLDAVGRAYSAGTIYAPWPAFASRVEKEAQRAEAAHEVTTSASDEPKEVRQLKRYIRNAGYLHDDPDVIRAEIDAQLGPALAGDRFLVGEMLELWRERRLQVGWG